MCVGEPWLGLLADRVQLMLLLLLMMMSKLFVQTFCPNFSEGTFVLFSKKRVIFYSIAAISRSFLKIGSESGKFRARRDIRHLLHSKVAL